MKLVSTDTAAPPSSCVWLQGCRFDALSQQQAVASVIDALGQRRGGWMVTANLDHLRRMKWGGDHYNELCADADLIVADGMPLIWASRVHRTPLPQRVAGSDLVWSLSEAAAANGRSIFLLGGAGDSASRASDVLKRRFPSLQIAGHHCPPLGFEHDSSELRKIDGYLDDVRPDIVYVALGSPKQEQLIAGLRRRFPQTWWLGVGISFSFISGELKRPPHWMQRMGLEWLGRLMQEPGRLWKRYLIHDVPFGFVLLATAYQQRRNTGQLARRAA